MRSATLPIALSMLCAAAVGSAAAQETPRPTVAVVVVTLDDITQGQARYGRTVVEALARERWGRLTYAEPPVPASAFDECRDNAPPESLNHCIRFLLDRAGGAAHRPPVVVVVLDDQPPGAPRHRGADELQVTCFGPGKAASDPVAQTTWLWPDALRIHGVNDWDRDQAALAACITAAMAEAT